MKKIIYQLALPLIVMVAFACKKDNDPVTQPVNPNEGELITTMKLVVKDSANTAQVSEFVFRDADGDGGQSPTTFDTIKLKANNTYLVSILLLDESKTPVDTISNEVLEEAEEHQLFYTAIEGANISFSYSDKDDNAVPLGLSGKLRTGSVSKGKLQVQLKHQGTDKPKSGNGNINIGDTDIEVNFPILIQ